MNQTLEWTEFLALDCQSTGANPDRGNLLELAWARTSAHGGCGPVRAFLVRLPERAEIPPRVSKLTGIVDSMMAEARDPLETWGELASDAQAIALPAPCLIHFARFELPFLYRLHSGSPDQAAFPLRVVCLHEIARRLFPELPRRGLRALAGYWGFSVGELKRAGDHVRATAHIWSRLVDELGRRGMARSLGELESWLAEPLPRIRTAEPFCYPISRGRLQSLPDSPGVYRFYRSNDDILYVGKARSLRQRVRSYFGRRPRHSEHILEMVTQAARVEVCETSSALMAAILESDEIKRLDPPYNRLLRAGDRQVAFLDWELTAPLKTAARGHGIGPVSPVEPVLAAGALLNRCAGPDTGDQHLKQVLPWADEVPDVTVREGFMNWRSRWAEDLCMPGQARFVVLAARAMAEAAEAAAEESMEEDAADGESAEVDAPGPADREWSAEEVARALDSIIRLAGRMLDRGGWLSRLSNCRIRWRRQASPNWNCIEVSDWNVSDRFVAGSDESAGQRGRTSVTGRRERSLIAPSDFDRLRVLSTELKRLCREGAEVEVELSPTRVLRGRRLEAILKSRG